MTQSGRSVSPECQGFLRMYDRLKRALIPAFLLAAVSAVGFQQNAIPLWAAFLGIALAIPVGMVLFLRGA